MAHKDNEPIFITKNGYSDLAIMSNEHYNYLMRNNKIDQAILEAENEVLNGARPVDAETVFKDLGIKYFE